VTKTTFIGNPFFFSFCSTPNIYLLVIQKLEKGILTYSQTIENCKRSAWHFREIHHKIVI